MISVANLVTHDCSFHFDKEMNFYAPENFDCININFLG